MAERSPRFPFFIAVVFLLVTTVALLPGLRMKVQNWLQGGPDRQVLSTVRTEFLGDNLFLVGVKVKTPDGIYFELYETKDFGKNVLLDRVLLPYDRDGWIHFNEQHSNLILYDVTGDGRPEFLVPTFDPMRTPHLSVFRLDLQTKTLRREAWTPDPDSPF